MAALTAALFACTGPAVTGTAGSGPFSGATWTNAATLNVSYSHCTQAGVPFNVQCALSDSFTGQTGAVSTREDIRSWPLTSSLVAGNQYTTSGALTGASPG